MCRSAVTVLLLAAIPALSQAPSAPPIKMGLWQGTTVTTMKGVQLSPEVVEKLKAMGRPIPGSEPRTLETESCLTPDKWKEMFTRTQNRENCKVTNLQQDSKGLSADIACQMSTGSSKGHVQMDFVSQEKVHGTMHIEAATSSQAQPVILDMIIDSTYGGADCKGISPDTPKVIMK